MVGKVVEYKIGMCAWMQGTVQSNKSGDLTILADDGEVDIVNDSLIYLIED